MHAPTTRSLMTRLLAGAATATLLLGCSSDGADTDDAATAAAADSIRVELARSPVMEPGETSTAVYAIVANDSVTPMRLVSATSELADSVDLIDIDGNVVLPAQGLDIPADGGLVMEADYHPTFQLNGIEPVEIGGTIPVTLRFENGEVFSFDAVVEAAEE